MVEQSRIRVERSNGSGERGRTAAAATACGSDDCGNADHDEPHVLAAAGWPLRAVDVARAEIHISGLCESRIGVFIPGGASSLLSAVVRLLLLVPGLEAFFFCKLPLLLLLCASRRRRPRRANPGCGVHPPCSLHTHLPRVQLGQHVGRQEQRGWLTVQEAERSNTHAAVASPLAPSLGWTPPVHASLQPATAPLSPVPPLLHAFAVALQRLGRDGASSSSRSSSSSSSSSAGRRETE